MSSKKNILFIVNPKSGHHSKRVLPELISTYINKDNFEFDIAHTGYIGHASEIAGDAVKSGVDVVVAVGGDGTVNEVARVLVESKTALGILPCGSGNGLARHLGIPIDVKRALDFLNSASVEGVDYGRINGLPFFCTCGVGFDALVSSNFAESKRRGFVGYINRALLDLVQYKPEVYEIQDESGVHNYKAFLIACGNAAQYGNNAYIAPKASMKDGKLNITILEPFSVVDIPVILGQLFNKCIDQNSHIKTMESKWLKIKRSKPGVVHFDGEPRMMDADLEIEIIEGGLTVLTSPLWNGMGEMVPIYKQVMGLIGDSIPGLEFKERIFTLPWQSDKTE